MNILVSDEAAPRIALRLPPSDRLMHMDGDGAIRAGEEVVARDGVSADVVWLTPDVLLNRRRRRAFLDYVLETPGVGWVQSAAAGTDVAAFGLLLARGTRVSNAHVNAIPISEFVFASVLEHFQGLERRRQLQRDHVWRQDQYREIYATTWLVVGLGHIGSEVARRAMAFGATVLGVRRHASGDEPVHEMLTRDELAEHIPRADVIVVAVPGTSDTRHLVDAGFLARVGRGAVLVNVARGSVVDEAALLAALDQGRPELAVLDTVATEPLPPESPLWSHERIRITCHTAALGTGRLERGTELFLENLGRFRAGASLVNELTAADVSDIASDIAPGGPGRSTP
jgi:phosphoglycerate dehydrogenase-like enzyme